MWNNIFKLGSLLLLLKPVLANVDDQTSAQIDRGTFANPHARVRPRFRYWLPDSSVDAQTVQNDIKSAGAIGAGGVEFLPFYNYGGALGGEPTGDDWSKYGFGTPAFSRLLEAALRAHKEAGLFMDFALGPNQGQGVPAKVNDTGLQWDLEPFTTEIPDDGKFDGIIPGWGAGDLVAVVSFEVLSSENITLSGTTSSLSGTSQSSYLQLVLRNGSQIEWTRNVSSTGNLSFKLPQTQSSTYRLFAFYEFQTHTKNLEYTNNQSVNVFNNGSYVVDHYSRHGARTTASFWEEYLLTEEVEQLLRDVGNYGWEDSVEIESTISWTPSLPEVFQSKYNYDIKPMLPLVMFGDNNINIQSGQPGAIDCILDTSDSGLGYVHDFRGALGEGYRNYLQELTAWLNSRLNLQMSAQVSYNLPMDMESNIPFVNAPECESLQFNSNIDGYRQFSGPANLAGKRVISNEMGAEFFKGYRFPHSELLAAMNHAFAGGINQLVLHGQSYTGDYYGTTWPGYTAFSYLVSELYSEKQPSWNNGFEDVLNYAARVQYLQQSGVPRMDVAIYNKVSATNPNFPTLYPDSDLIDAGYTYSYLSPDNFVLPQAEIKDNKLGSTGPAYKALLVTSDSNLTLDGVTYIQRYARTGLPVILSGGAPGVYASRDERDKPTIEKAIQTLKKSKNVYSVPSGKVATKLHALGLAPRVAVETNGTWYPTWREDSGSGMDHAFILSSGNASTGTVSVKTKKAPWFLDPWTGTQKPVLHYQVQDDRVVIPLELAANQTVIIGFIDGKTKTTHATEVPSAVLGYSYDQKAGTVIHVSANPQKQSLVLSNGKRVTLPENAAKATTLSNWTLKAEHWEAPSNLSDAATIAVKHNTTHHLPSLVSWTEIPALQNVSGLGYYEKTITWPPSGHADGAYLTLSPIIHAARIYINGERLPTPDFAAPHLDLGSYLQHGLNTIAVVVPTTMWNYLQSLSGVESIGISLEEIEDLLGAAYFSLGDNGLVGPVNLIPYVKMRITG